MGQPQPQSPNRGKVTQGFKHKVLDHIHSVPTLASGAMGLVWLRSPGQSPALEQTHHWLLKFSVLPSTLNPFGEKFEAWVSKMNG